MAIAYNVGAVAGKNYEAGAASSTTTGVTTTGGSGSLFLAFVYHEQSGEGFSSITDSYTNTWEQVGSTLNNGAHYTRVYSCHGGSGGSGHTFTVTYTATGAVGIAVVELTGCATSSAVDKVAQVFDNAEPFSSGATSTTAQNNEMLVGYFRGDSTANETFAVDSSSNPTSGWTKRLEFTQAGESVRELPTLVATVGVTSTGTYSFACTAVSAEGHAIIVTVKEGSASTAVPVFVHHVKQMGAR